MSLTSGFFPSLVVGLAVLALVAGIDWRGGHWRRQVLVGAVAAIALTDLIGLGQLHYDWVPYSFPVRYYAWIGVVVFALGASLSGRRIGWWRRGLSLVAVPLTLMSAIVLINADYQYYPSVESLTGSGAQHSTSLLDLLSQRHRHPHATGVVDASGPSIASPPAQQQIEPQATDTQPFGESTEVTIPATRSHFAARPAWVWVPPAYVSGQVSTLPVIMLLGGSPGRTNDWLRSAYADRTAETFAEHHHGIAPILVMPDANGSLTGDTECVDGPAGNAETYLTQDVPAFMHTEFGTPSGRDYAVAGFSEGGTCAAMLDLRHPALFTGFADFSGLTSPTLSERVDARATARALFHGSMSEYLAHDPLSLLHERDLHGDAYFEVGTQDGAALQAQRQLVALARHSGLTVCAREVPGAGHTYDLWGQSFQDALPTLSAELDLTPPASPVAGCTRPPTSKAAGAVPKPAPVSPTR